MDPAGTSLDWLNRLLADGSYLWKQEGPDGQCLNDAVGKVVHPADVLVRRLRLVRIMSHLGQCAQALLG